MSDIPPEPTLCDEMEGDCDNCPEQLACSMPDPPELDWDQEEKMIPGWWFEITC